MRCDHLTPVIFRASGSKFRVMVRASAREIPHATASRHQRRKIAKRAACCLLCASIVESRNARYSLQNRPTQPPHRFPPCRSLTDRASAHLCPDTPHNATNPPARNSPTDAPQIRSRSSTTDQKLTTAQTFRTRSSSALVHRLKLFSETTES